MILLRPSIELGLALLLASPVPGSPPSSEPRDPEIGILVQSELEYLEGHDREISLELRDATPENALRALAAVSGFSVEIVGRLPEPKLSRSFSKATPRQVLEWIAARVDVGYAVRGPKKLMVISRSKASPVES